MRRSNYQVVENTDDYLVIRDLGPWDQYLTVTNDADEVVGELVKTLNGRRLEYYDSDGERAEIFIKDGRFAGFGSIKRSNANARENHKIDSAS